MQLRGVQARSGQGARNGVGRVCQAPSRACSTGLKEWLPGGHRTRTRFSRWSENQGLARSVRDREWWPDAVTNSSSVNCVRVLKVANSAETPAPPSSAGLERRQRRASRRFHGSGFARRRKSKIDSKCASAGRVHRATWPRVIRTRPKSCSPDLMVSPLREVYGCVQ
jgi:predicted nucleic acid-binding Zn ribbon protein